MVPEYGSRIRRAPGRLSPPGAPAGFRRTRGASGGMGIARLAYVFEIGRRLDNSMPPILIRVLYGFFAGQPCFDSVMSSGRYSKCMLSTWNHMAPQMKPWRSKIAPMAPGTRLRHAKVPERSFRLSQ